jgi:hypothetical protein
MHAHTCVKNGIKQASHPGMVAHAWDPTFEFNLDVMVRPYPKLKKKKKKRLERGSWLRTHTLHLHLHGSLTPLASMDT